jgi:cellulose synthase/poly-beta-1,6-N-acetylglucosamine synthase-like glycosyltransferase
MNASVVLILVAAVFVAWLLVATISCFGAYRAQRDRPEPFVPARGEMVLIIPVRGVPVHLAEMWRGISAQSYRSFRVVFAVEGTSDPAYAALRGLEGGPQREIVVAGPTTKRAQKIHNMLAALGSLKDSDTVVMFADADIVPRSDWLARLMRWQKDINCDVVSGYRWMLPADDRWATAFVCVINSSLATAARRRPPFGLAWGGSMVMHRNAIAGLELEKCWDRAVLDDLTLTRAVWAHGGRVQCPRDALVPSPASYSWKDAIAFARRQYLFIRIHTPWHWALIAAITMLPLAGWIAALPLAVNGSVGAIGVIIAANVLDQMRAHFRRRVPQKLWNLDIPDRVARLDRWGTPIWLLVNAVVIWSTLVGRRITWADRSYVVDGRGQVLRIEAAHEPQRIPSPAGR